MLNTEKNTSPFSKIESKSMVHLWVDQINDLIHKNNFYRNYNQGFYKIDKASNTRQFKYIIGYGF